SALLIGSQKNVARVSARVLQGIEVITNSARDTGDDLSRMIERMEFIDQGGKAIDGITVLIDDITDRINLLSLNAAIEAARAGEHGRGFAVVADEIGKLATATSDNSKEISTRIKNMISDILQGKMIVDKTKKSIDIIFKSIEDINSLIDETKLVLTEQGNAISEVVGQANLMESMASDIADATREQNSSMEENIKTVSRLSEIAQEIASANQKILEFTGSIVEKSKQLQEIVGGR
ncbi:MAG TPA: methyl-accepting chemotaxis protein, partial [Spirochaetota bacterium]|nr:methyl-accepting chemotaxis protein [Spirochaetota bacterium]